MRDILKPTYGTNTSYSEDKLKWPLRAIHKKKHKKKNKKKNENKSEQYLSKINSYWYSDGNNV